jgi:ABC-type nickel/cobalt efflux system permease component RcnA
MLSTVWWCLMALSGLAIVQHVLLRVWTRSNFDVPLSYWWLMGVGGLLVGAIGPVSIWRTRTGRGWTWKGRALG